MMMTVHIKRTDGVPAQTYYWPSNIRLDNEAIYFDCPMGGRPGVVMTKFVVIESMVFSGDIS